MGIKIKIKNKLDGNYKLLTRGLNRKKNNFNKKTKKNQKNKEQIEKNNI
jgi:hypothetical protein